MKSFKMILIVFLILVSTSVVFAEKPEELPRFKSGIMGEIFEGLAGVGGQVQITSSDLVGEWICDSYTTPKVIDNPNTAEEWEVDNENLVGYFLGGTKIFLNDGDGTYSSIQTTQCPFYVSTTDTSIQCPYKIINNILYIECAYFFIGQPRIFPSIYTIDVITPNKLIFKLIYGSSFSVKTIFAERVITP